MFNRFRFRRSVKALTLFIISFFMLSSYLLIIDSPDPVEAAPLNPQCTALPNASAREELTYESMYVSNMVADSEYPVAAKNDRSVIISEIYNHGDLNNAFGETYDPNARYYEATFNSQSLLSDTESIISNYTTKPFFNLYVSRGWRLDPRLFIDVYSGTAGYTNTEDNLVIDSQLYNGAYACPVNNEGILDCTTSIFMDWPDYKHKNPAYSRGSDTESLDAPIYYHYDSGQDGRIWSLNTYGQILGYMNKSVYYTDPTTYPNYSVLFDSRNYRWISYTKNIAALMEDGSNPASYPFLLNDGRRHRGYFGDPNDKYNFTLNLAKAVGGSFSFRYLSMKELSQKSVKVRFKVTRDPNYTGDVPFFVGGSLKSYDKNVDFIRSVFKFQSASAPITNYPIKVTHRVFSSVDDRNAGKLKPGDYGPPQHKLKISFQSASNMIPLQNIDYPNGNPVSLCYYYPTKRKVGATTDPFSIGLYTANGDLVPLKTIINPFDPRDYHFEGEYPDGKKTIPVYIMPSRNYMNNDSTRESRYNNLRPNLHPYESRWTIDWIDPDNVRISKFTTQVPQEQKVVSPGQVVNPRIRVLDTARRGIKDVPTKPTVTVPNGSEHIPYQNGIVSSADGYLRNAGNYMPYQSTQQQGLYKVFVKEYKTNTDGSWAEATAEMREPLYDDFLVSDSAQNIVADHYFTLNYSNYIWNIDKSAWVTNKGVSHWQSLGEMYRNGGQPGQALNARGAPFPNKFRLKISVVEKADGAGVLTGSVNLRYFPKPNAPRSYTLPSPRIIIPGYPTASCQIIGGEGMVIKAFETVSLNYSCYFPSNNYNSPVDFDRLNPQIALNNSVKLFNYTASKARASDAKNNAQQLITLRDNFTDSTINNNQGVDIDLSDPKYKGHWCADPSNNSPECTPAERIDRTDAYLGGSYQNNPAMERIIAEVKNNKPVISQNVMVGMKFRNLISKDQYFGGSYGNIDVRDRLGANQENGKYNNSSRVIYYFYEVPSTTAPVTWKKQDQLLTNKAYACNENYDTYSGFRANPSTAPGACRLANGGTVASASVKIINDFEDVLIRIRRSDGEDNAILNQVGTIHYDPQLCGNHEAVTTSRPAMLATIANSTGQPVTLSPAQAKACFLPAPGSQLLYSMLLNGSEHGYADGKYSLHERSALLGSFLLPEGITFELADKEFYWLNGNQRSATQPDNLAYVSEESVAVPVNNRGVTEKQKAFVITLLDIRKGTLPATGGLGVYLPLLLGSFIMIGFAYYRYRFSER